MSEIETGQVTPEVPLAEATQSAPVPEATAAPENTDSQEAEQPNAPERTFTQKEMDEKLQRERATAYRKAKREARAELERDHYKSLYETATQPKQTEQPTGEPQSGQFQDYESYTKALAKWEAKQEFERLQNEHRSRMDEQSKAQKAQTIMQRLSKGEKEYDDFYEVVTSSDAPFTESLVEAIADSDVAHKLAYTLSNDPQKVRELVSMSPLKMARELLKIEAALTAPPKPTQTPPPIVPNAATATAKKDVFDFDPGNKAAWKKFQLERSKARASR